MDLHLCGDFDSRAFYPNPWRWRRRRQGTIYCRFSVSNKLYDYRFRRLNTWTGNLYIYVTNTEQFFMLTQRWKMKQKNPSVTFDFDLIDSYRKYVKIHILSQLGFFQFSIIMSLIIWKMNGQKREKRSETKSHLWNRRSTRPFSSRSPLLFPKQKRGTRRKEMTASADAEITRFKIKNTIFFSEQFWVAASLATACVCYC